MITVYAPLTTVGHMNASPFVAKLETWLRLAGIPYRLAAANPLRAPRGKVPWIEDEGGQLLPDSQHIIEHLTRVHGVRLDEGLDAAQRAQARAVRRMLEEATYFLLVHQRWVEDEGWAFYKPIMGRAAPALFLGLIRREVRKRNHGQGTGRHTSAQIAAMAIDDFAAVSTILGDRPFLLGEQPTSVDATVYAFVHGVVAFPGEDAVQRAVRATPNLMAYVERLTRAVWPEAAPRLLTGG